MEFFKCKLCGKDSPQTYKSKEFCSVLCSCRYTTSLRKKRVTVNCLICGKEYELQVFRIKDGKKYFCSDACRMSWNNRTTKLCKCGKEFSVPSVRKDTAKYCSIPCRDKYMWEERKIYEFRNSGFSSKDRIRGIFLYGNKCELCGWDKIVEVHHIDSNRDNHNDDNLCVLCPNCHTLTEHKYRDNINYIDENKMEELIKNVRTRGN